MTAETAVVVPSLVFLMAVLMWGMAAVVARVQCVDGARAGARAAARGESGQVTEEAVRAVAPLATTVVVSEEGEWVRVRVRARSPGPDALTWSIGAEAVALDEDAVGRRPGPEEAP